MDCATLIGSIAGALTTISFLPQVVRIIRTKKTRDLSPAMYIILCAGVVLWVIYGLLLKSLPVIIANSIVIVLSLYILMMKFKYK